MNLLPASTLTLLLLLSTAGISQAEGEHEIRDEEGQFMLTPPEGFTVQTRSDGILVAFAGPDDALMTLSRIDYSNLPAWRKRENDTFIEQIEQGIKRAAPNYKLKRKKAERIDGVPAFDISFVRTSDRGSELVWMRFLFHRRYALVATATSPAHSKRAIRNKGRDYTRSLRPFKAP